VLSVHNKKINPKFEENASFSFYESSDNPRTVAWMFKGGENRANPSTDNMIGPAYITQVGVVRPEMYRI